MIASVRVPREASGPTGSTRRGITTGLHTTTGRQRGRGTTGSDEDSSAHFLSLHRTVSVFFLLFFFFVLKSLAGHTKSMLIVVVLSAALVANGQRTREIDIEVRLPSGWQVLEFSVPEEFVIDGGTTLHLLKPRHQPSPVSSESSDPSTLPSSSPVELLFFSCFHPRPTKKQS